MINLIILERFFKLSSRYHVTFTRTYVIIAEFEYVPKIYFTYMKFIWILLDSIICRDMHDNPSHSVLPGLLSKTHDSFLRTLN